MTPDEKSDVLRRLLSQQHAIRTVVEAANLQAELAQAAGHEGFALAIHMLRESLMVYSKELSRFVEEYVSAD